MSEENISYSSDNLSGQEILKLRHDGEDAAVTRAAQLRALDTLDTLGACGSHWTFVPLLVWSY